MPFSSAAPVTRRRPATQLARPSSEERPSQLPEKQISEKMPYFNGEVDVGQELVFDSVVVFGFVEAVGQGSVPGDDGDGEAVVLDERPVLLGGHLYGLIANASGRSDEFLRAKAATGKGIEADGLFDGGHKLRSCAEHFGDRGKRGIGLEGIHGPLADAVPEGGQVRAGRSKGINVEVFLGPFVEKVPLAVRRLDDDEVVVLRVDVVGNKDRGDR